MPRIWWTISEDGLPLKDGRIIADTYGKADRILFYRMLKGQCEPNCTLIEELPDENEVSDQDIISVDEITI